MLQTDYSNIADRYDNNPIRKKPLDPYIRTLLAEKSRLRIMDVSCGTGNYFQSQTAYYKTGSIEWIGLDKSSEMLSIAKQKNPQAYFIHSSIEELKIDDSLAGSVHYMRNEFAFHHFSDRIKAFSNMYKMLVEGGILHIENIFPDYIKNSWVVKYFPSVQGKFEKQFPSARELYGTLQNAGFSDVKMKIDSTVNQIDYDLALLEARNRDMSQLNLISESEYQLGLKRLEADAAQNKVFINDFSLIICRCKK